MWLDKLKELKKTSGMSAKQIADKTNMSERTVSRIFSGDTYAPGIDKLRDIVYAMGGSLDDILVESDFRVPTPEAQALKATVNELTAENVRLKDENAMLKAELDHLRLTLAHKEESLAYQQQIMELQEQLLRIHKNSSHDNGCWKL